MARVAAQAVVVAGANWGLGREFAHQLLERGVTNVSAAAGAQRRSRQPTRASNRSSSTSRTPDSVARAAELADAVSVLVNNAGILAGAPVVGDDS
jgi:NAD(P)-dependent dehydrogenase (short-subunit alcohol dehydrogenase family)